MGVSPAGSRSRVILATAGPALAALGLVAAGVPILAAAALTVLLALGAAWLLGRSQLGRLSRLTERAATDARDERHAAEAERDRLATLVAGLADAILIIDATERVRLANPAAERMLDAGSLVGRRVVEVVRDHEVLDAIVAARGGSEVIVQVERTQPQRLLRVAARRLEGGELLVTIHDLSAVRRLETVRADFVANVSHELRTPIATLKAIAETLEGGAIEDRTAARDFVSRMQEEIDGLAQLVQELLSLARVESGADRLTIVDLPPELLLHEAARRMAALAERAGVALEVSAEDDLPQVAADPDRIGQVLANLVHNAVQFTPPGGRIRLTAAARGEQVELAVHDTGAGIDPQDLDRIFERFYKSDRSRASGGTGLGLAIAKHIVQAHGGEIRAESAGPGRGAMFAFTLPAAPGKARETAEGTAPLR